MVDKKTTQENTRTPIDGTELVRLATSSDNWKTTIDAALSADWQTSRSSFSGTELVRVTGASSLNWKAPVSAILDANWETTKSSLSGTEVARITDSSSANWKISINSVLDANWETTRSSLSGTELVRITGDSSNNWKTTINSVIGANWETTLNPIAGTETVRLTDPSTVNWKATVSKILDAPHPVDDRTFTTFANLPPAAQNSGAIARITDSNTTRIGYPAAGGGSNLISVQSDGTIWRVIGSPYGRRVLCGNALFYLSPTGNDTTGDGQVTNPFKTFTRAMDELYGTGTGAGIDTNGFITTFALTDGIHDYSSGVFGSPVAVDFSEAWNGGGPIQIQSVSGNASACTILGALGGGTAISVSGQLGGRLTVQNLSFQGWHVNVWGGWYGAGDVWCINLIHYSGDVPNHIECASPNVQMQVFGHDKIEAFQANSHLFARQGGRIHYFCSSATIVNSTMVIAAGWTRAQDADSCIDFEPPTYTGTYHGPAWDVSGGGNVSIWGNANWTPMQPTTAYPNIIIPDPGGGETQRVIGSGTLQYALNTNIYERMGAITGVQQIRLTGDYSDGFFYVTLTPYRETGFTDITTTYSLALPKVQGAPGATLSNDGTGQLSWAGGLIPSSVTLNFYVAKLDGATVGGASYTPGTYSNVALTGGSGTGATADIVVSSATNTVTLVKPSTMGSSYVIGDVLSAPSSIIGSSGAGFTFTIQAIGSNSTSVTGQSSSTPFATITHSVNTMALYDYQTAAAPSLYVANGIYDEGNNCFLPTITGGIGLASVRGRSSNPDACQINTVSDVLVTLPGNWTAWGLTCYSAVSGGSVGAGGGSYFEVYDMREKCIDWALLASGDGFLYSQNNTVVPQGSSNSRPPGLVRNIDANGRIWVFGTQTVEGSCWNMSSVGAYVYSQGNNQIILGTTDFVNSSVVSGRQYNLGDNAIYSGAKLTDLPGTTGGTISPSATVNGAFYDLTTHLSTSVTPPDLATMMFQRVTSTQIQLVLLGTDSVMRYGSITLSSS